MKTGQLNPKRGKSVGRPMPGVFEQVTALPPHVTNIGTVAVSLPHVARIAQQADETIARLTADLARRAEHDDESAERTNRLLSGIEEQRDDYRAQANEMHRWAEREKTRADTAAQALATLRKDYDALYRDWVSTKADLDYATSQLAQFEDRRNNGGLIG